MRIFGFEEGAFCAQDTLAGALRFEGGVAAFVGGGGKSTLIGQLARELNAAGKRVIVTTTTHIAVPEKHYALADVQGMDAALARGEIVVAGQQETARRLGGDVAALPMLRARCDALLVEADGAHRFPFKAPEAWEPVLPPQVDLVVGVAGLDALGQKIAQLHRPHCIARLCEKAQEDILTPQDMARVLQSGDGQKKGVRGRYVAVLNKADDEKRMALARAVAEAMPGERVVVRGGEESDHRM